MPQQPHVQEGARRGVRSATATTAVPVLRWFLGGARMRQLARDNAISKSTGYDYPHEGIDVLADRAPSLIRPGCGSMPSPAPVIRSWRYRATRTPPVA
ncbi:hypothetical protein [Dactylosporangium sp. CA-092794]|uniref:hypothetical protein n=1 Tax=Dactylosporangium sp. CA-092794 TaxID=3239929 RepID=UPI003D8E910D